MFLTYIVSQNIITVPRSGKKCIMEKQYVISDLKSSKLLNYSVTVGNLFLSKAVLAQNRNVQLNIANLFIACQKYQKEVAVLIEQTFE